MSSDDKDHRVNRAALIRQIVLLFFPFVSLFFKNWTGVAVSSVISVLAIILDRLRSQRRAIPFLLYLFIVWTIQAMSLTLVLSLGSDHAWTPPVLGLEHPDVAMDKWAAFDEQAKAGANAAGPDSEWDPDRYPWIKEFPPLGPNDSKPEIRTATVILAAHNEHKYLERTINSILAESDPKELIEIIVVDDASEPPLSEITDKMKLPQVIVIRHESRQGLIRSKSVGADAAKGDLIIFLDAHVKPEKNWLAPLFRHTNENWMRVVTPVIPILNGETWTVDSSAVGYKMMFDWAMGFNWFDDGNDWVPIMSGGLLALTRRYWHWSGEYDKGMLQWGAENIEQSIRVWLCGGEIVVARDSRVSHVFRPTFPYAINHTQVNVNKVRLIEVWFDEYKEFYYRSDPFARTLVDKKGDVTERLELKNRLHCKPFQYFVDRFRSVFDMKNMLPKRHLAIKDETTGKCLETFKNGGIKLGSCAMALGETYRSAFRFISDEAGPESKTKGLGIFRSLKYSSRCFDANGGVAAKNGVKVLLYTCMAKNPQQQNWVVKDGGLRWNNHCAYIDDKTKELTLGECTVESTGFLGKPFNGHPAHRWVIADDRTMEIAKSDKDVKRDLDDFEDEED